MLRSVAARTLSHSANANICLAITSIISDRAVCNALIRFQCRAYSALDEGIGIEITNNKDRGLSRCFLQWRSLDGMLIKRHIPTP